MQYANLGIKWSVLISTFHIRYSYGHFDANFKTKRHKNKNHERTNKDHISLFVCCWITRDWKLWIDFRLFGFFLLSIIFKLYYFKSLISITKLQDYKEQIAKKNFVFSCMVSYSNSIIWIGVKNAANLIPVWMYYGVLEWRSVMVINVKIWCVWHSWPSMFQ